MTDRIAATTFYAFDPAEARSRIFRPGDIVPASVVTQNDPLGEPQVRVGEHCLVPLAP